MENFFSLNQVLFDEIGAAAVAEAAFAKNEIVSHFPSICFTAFPGLYATRFTKQRCWNVHRLLKIHRCRYHWRFWEPTTEISCQFYDGLYGLYGTSVEKMPAVRQNAKPTLQPCLSSAEEPHQSCFDLSIHHREDQDHVSLF